MTLEEIEFLTQKENEPICCSNCNNTIPYGETYFEGDCEFVYCTPECVAEVSGLPLEEVEHALGVV